MIRAECHSDDLKVEIDFDATPWFAQADLDSIIALADCGWRGDYPADEVALHFSETVTKDVFVYVALTIKYEGFDSEIGFECSVNDKDAMDWLLANQPETYRKVRLVVDANT